jgi:hypothetical protein
MGDPRSFIGRCVSIASVFTAMKDLQRNRLGGRSLDIDNDLGQKNHEILACPCNGTYVSEACCTNLEGQVWEPLSLKLGELKT